MSLINRATTKINSYFTQDQPERVSDSALSRVASEKKFSDADLRSLADATSPQAVEHILGQKGSSIEELITVSQEIALHELDASRAPGTAQKAEPSEASH